MNRHQMKELKTWVNKKEYHAFSRKAEELELSDYALVKKIVLDYLNSDVPSDSDGTAHLYVKKIKMLKHQQRWAIGTIFVLTCYFVVSLAYILFFSR